MIWKLNALKKKGVRFIDHKEYQKLKNTKVLIRAHGEPPKTFLKAKENNIKLTDATCPIVTKLQERIVKTWEEVKSINGQLVIFGNRTHPEIIGLSGQIDYKALIVEDINELDNLDFEKPIRLFSQTTKSKELYQEIIDTIQKKVDKLNKSSDFFMYKKSVCGQVANRTPDLRIVAQNHDVIIFVSGEKSSNGKYLYGICKEVNSRSHKISKPDQIDKKWFENIKTIGVSGATSTPSWLLDDVINTIKLF